MCVFGTVCIEQKFAVLGQRLIDHTGILWGTQRIDIGQHIAEVFFIFAIKVRSVFRNQSELHQPAVSFFREPVNVHRRSFVEVPPWCCIHVVMSEGFRRNQDPVQLLIALIHQLHSEHNCICRPVRCPKRNGDRAQIHATGRLSLPHFYAKRFLGECLQRESIVRGSSHRCPVKESIGKEQRGSICLHSPFMLRTRPDIR